MNFTKEAYTDQGRIKFIVRYSMLAEYSGM